MDGARALLPPYRDDNVNPPAPAIWLIDESRAVRSYVVASLEPLGGAVEHFGDPRAVAQHLSEDAASLPDLVIMESHFRQTSGVALLKRLRQSKGGKRVSVLLFTGNAEPEEIRACFVAGADSCLAKPAQGEDLLLRVRLLLTNPHSLQQCAADQGRPALLVSSPAPEAVSLCTLLDQRGHRPLWTDNPLAAQRLLRPDVHLALLDYLFLQEGLDPLLARLREQVANLKVVLLASPLRASGAEARCGRDVQSVLITPVAGKALDQVLDSLCETESALADLPLEKPYARRVVSGARPFPPLLSQALPVPFRRLLSLVREAPELIERGLVRAAAPVAVCPRQEGTGARALVVEAEEPLPAAGVKLLATELEQPEPAFVDATGRALDSFPLQATFDFGRWLYEERRLAADALMCQAHRVPTGSLVMEMDETLGQKLQPLLHGLFDYLDLHLLHWCLSGTKQAEALDHAVRVAALSMRAGLAWEERHPFPDASRQAILTVLGLGGFLHDLANLLWPVTLGEVLDGGENYGEHAAAGYRELVDLRLFEAVKVMVRDHHLDLQRGTTRYGAATRLVQLGNDFDNLVRANGVLCRGKTVALSPEPYSPDEACLILLDRAREGAYAVEDLAIFFAGVGRQTLLGAAV